MDQMDTTEARADRLRRAMRGRTQAWLAEEIGVATSSINGYLKGKIPQADVCLRMCDALAVDIRWYLDGNSPPGEKAQGERVVQVPFVDDATKALTFTTGLLDMFGVPYESLCCIGVQGTMMAPGVPKGSEVLATRSFSNIEDGKVYILQLGSGFVLRRLRVRGDGGLVAVCDNPAVQNDLPDEIVHEDVAAVALWSGHSP
ncbi:helix-turn-helix domain-containing protein [Rhizobium laguerreae]|uniref:XRE family transcriptional regulator n=1 Tax=Rhizobium laguerreae TaxID=1076926 RepID=UPI001C90B7EE|nr:LexA family transcriptional regulator [Rhizobium laguerreae]MBY3155559.1 helix-turn-helix domain-containing protein [Rhizobium laguerreae]